MLIRRLAESELEKQRLAADFDQLQRDHAALMESLAAKQQRVDAETIVGDDLNNGIAPVTTEVPPSPAAKTPLELELKGNIAGAIDCWLDGRCRNIYYPHQDLKKKFKISATVMKQYHKRISKLQDDRDALLEEMQRIRSELAHPVHDAPSTPATPQSGGSVHSGTTSVLESIMVGWLLRVVTRMYDFLPAFLERNPSTERLDCLNPWVIITLSVAISNALRTPVICEPHAIDASDS